MPPRLGPPCAFLLLAAALNICARQTGDSAAACAAVIGRQRNFVTVGGKEPLLPSCGYPAQGCEFDLFFFLPQTLRDFDETGGGIF